LGLVPPSLFASVLSPVLASVTSMLVLVLTSMRAAVL